MEENEVYKEVKVVQLAELSGSPHSLRTVALTWKRKCRWPEGEGREGRATLFLQYQAIRWA